MSVYTKAIDTADALIAKFGLAMTLTRVTASAYNPATGTTSNTTAAATIKGVFQSLSDSQVAGNNEQSNADLIKAGRRKILIAAKGIPAPDAGDKISVGSDTYLIVSVNALSPASEPIYYTATVEVL